MPAAERSDRRALGRAPSLDEPGIDLGRLRRDRLAKVQAELAAAGVGAALLTDPGNLRYCTGLSTFQLWSAANLTHYALVPATGEPVLFEYPGAAYRAERFFADVRPAALWQPRFSGRFAAERVSVLAAEVADVLRGWDVADAPLAVDALDVLGFAALTDQGLRLVDADGPLVAARLVKTPDELELLRQSCGVVEAALHDVEQAIRPGVSEQELLGVFQHRLLALGGEYCSTRLLVSGHKTNPWFQEAGSKLVRPGELVAMDTDAVGPHGTLCDVSRTFVCGDRPSAAQRQAYRVAYDFVAATVDLLRPGLGYADLAAAVPAFPEAYRAQRYPVLLHGVGCDDEPPWIPFDDDDHGVMPDGALRADMVVAVEAYAGRPGHHDGVKLEDMVWISGDGPVVLSHYPYDERLLG